jgi:hypothetical protein
MKTLITQTKHYFFLVWLNDSRVCLVISCNVCNGDGNNSYYYMCLTTSLMNVLFLFRMVFTDSGLRLSCRSS